MEPVAWKIERIAKRARNDSLQKTISKRISWRDRKYDLFT